jgi:GTP-binding protein Era
MKEKTTYVTTVAFVGQPNVGKSTLLNALVGTKIAPTTRKPQTTRRIIRGIKTVGDYQHIYFDTPGIVRTKTGLDRFMHDQIFVALADVDQVVAIVDASDDPKRHLAFLKKIKQTIRPQQTFILAINKIDELREKSALLVKIARYADELQIETIVPISAMKNLGLMDLFQALNKAASAQDFLFSEDLFTDATEKEIVSELIREKAMLELKDELPYRLAVTIETFDESRREEVAKPLIAIDAVLHVERPTQKAIVIGKNGESIKTIGTRARKDLEHLLQCQVMLKLFVRVERNWTTSPKSLRKLGF